MAKILVLNGPNLNLLGTREPGLYGTDSLADIDKRLKGLARELGHELEARQSNAEHEMVEWMHNVKEEGFDFMLLNPAAFTHTSVALRDAVSASGIPFIEVHLSNIYARESFRKTSFFSDLAIAVISGLGADGYEAALRAADGILRSRGTGSACH